MNDAVVDASVILRWAFEDEADRAGALIVADALLSGQLRAFAPPNFRLSASRSHISARNAWSEIPSRSATPGVCSGSQTKPRRSKIRPHRCRFATQNRQSASK